MLQVTAKTIPLPTVPPAPLAPSTPRDLPPEVDSDLCSFAELEESCAMLRTGIDALIREHQQRFIYIIAGGNSIAKQLKPAVAVASPVEWKKEVSATTVDLPLQASAWIYDVHINETNGNGHSYTSDQATSEANGHHCDGQQKHSWQSDKSHGGASKLLQRQKTAVPPTASGKPIRKSLTNATLYFDEEDPPIVRRTHHQDPTVDAQFILAEDAAGLTITQRLAKCSQRPKVTVSALTSCPSLGDHVNAKAINTAIVRHPLFDMLCAFVIIMNSIFVGMEVENNIGTNIEENETFTLVGRVFMVFFSVELVMRMVEQGLEYIRGESKLWNAFDTILVVLSFLELIMEQMAMGDTSAKFKSLLTQLKMIRVIRIFRVIRFFQELALLVLMIMDSMKSLMWALVLLAVIIYVFGTYFTQMAADFNREYESELSLMQTERLEKRFGSVMRTIYSLVLSMLQGIGWEECTDALIEIGILPTLMFFFYICFTTLAVMNIITGTFVDRAMDVANSQREILIQKQQNQRAKYVTEMCELFHQMDEDGNGSLSMDEVKNFCDDPRVCAYLQALGIDAGDSELLFNLLDDEGGDGEVDMDEFLEGTMRLKGSARGIDVHQILMTVRRLRCHVERMERELKEKLGPEVETTEFVIEELKTDIS